MKRLVISLILSSYILKYLISFNIEVQFTRNDSTIDAVWHLLLLVIQNISLTVQVVQMLFGCDRSNSRSTLLEEESNFTVVMPASK
jgi:hypothetical protein